MTTVIEGDVVTETCVILPPSKEEKLRSLSQLSPEQQVDEVTTMLVQSNVGLLVAIAAQDLPGICEAKAKAATIAEIAKQLRMGKDMQLNAAEFVRRAERGLGVAIREGQARGEIRSRGQRADENMDTPRSSPTDYAKGSDLVGSGSQPGYYDLSDGVSDDQFEEALAEAKDEGNLSRANVARKCKAKASVPEPKQTVPEDDSLVDADADVEPKPPDMPPESDPEPAPRPFKKTDTEMLAEIVGSLANFADLMRYIRADHIDADDAYRLTRNAFGSIGQIRKACKEIRNAKA